MSRSGCTLTGAVTSLRSPPFREGVPMRREICQRIASLTVLVLVAGIGTVPAWAGDDEPPLTPAQCQQKFGIDGSKDKAYEKELVKGGNPAEDGKIPGIVT